MDEQQRKQAEAVQAAQAQLALILQQHGELVKTTNFCFDRCLGSQAPPSKTSRSAETCMWQCAQRVVEVRYFIKRRADELTAEPA